MNTFTAPFSVGSHTLATDELTVDMDDFYPYGDWGSVDTCHIGSYAAGIQLTVRY